MHHYSLRVITSTGTEIYRARGCAAAIRSALEQRPYLQDPGLPDPVVVHVQLLGGGRQWVTLESVTAATAHDAHAVGARPRAGS